MTTTRPLGRTYNQSHVPRPYVRGKRRFSVYWSWSYPFEANRDLTQLDNRFSSMTEVRRVAWPAYETEEYSARMFLQGIEGTLELFHLSLVSFQNAVEEVTGQPVAVYQRVDQAGQRLPLDERILADTDTLMIFGLDHMVADEEASAAEIAALEEFLSREGTCLILGPHHDVGSSPDPNVRNMEYYHHGDPLVPRQQRFAKYVRGLMKGLGAPVENRHGLRPATQPGTTRPVPIVAANDLDTRGWLDWRVVVRVPHAPAALRPYGREPQGHPRARPPADRSVEAAPVHGGRRPRDQHVPLDAARRQTRGRHPVRGLDDLHDALRRRRKPHALLEKPRGEVDDDGALSNSTTSRAACSARARRRLLPPTSSCASTTAPRAGR